MEISPTEMAWLDLSKLTEQKLKITNNGKAKQVVKIKCSDNKIFVINPVFSVGKSIEVSVTRAPAPMKPDKIVVCMAVASDADCKDVAGH